MAQERIKYVIPALIVADKPFQLLFIFPVSLDTYRVVADQKSIYGIAAEYRLRQESLPCRISFFQPSSGGSILS